MTTKALPASHRLLGPTRRGLPHTLYVFRARSFSQLTASIFAHEKKNMRGTRKGTEKTSPVPHTCVHWAAPASNGVEPLIRKINSTTQAPTGTFTNEHSTSSTRVYLCIHGLVTVAAATPPVLLLAVTPVLPALGVVLPSASFFPPARIKPTSVWLLSCAHCSGVLPLASLIVMSAP